MCWAAGVSALKFSHQHIMNYFPPEGDILITNPVTLLLIYSGHSELQVSKYLCWCLSAVGSLKSNKTKQQTAVVLKPSHHVQCGCSFPHPLLAFLPRLALSIYQNTLHSPVSVPPQPARVALSSDTVVVPLPRASCRPAAVWVQVCVCVCV